MKKSFCRVSANQTASAQIIPRRDPAQAGEKQTGLMKKRKLCVILFNRGQSKFKYRTITAHPTLETNNPYKSNKKLEKGRFLASLTWPLFFVVLLWIIKLIELVFGLSFSSYGIYPRELSGLKGVLLSPLIHGGFSHLVSNSIPLLVLGTALFYFYRELAPRIFMLGLLITGLWVWAIARQSFHIGASGVVYSLAAFLFVSGIIRRHPRLMALSLLVAFLYGSMIWGIFPIKEHISWESHLMGMVSGVLLAIFYRATGPQRPLYSWELEEEEEDPFPEMPADEAPATGGERANDYRPGDGEKHTDPSTPPEQESSSPNRIIYHYKEGKEGS